MFHLGLFAVLITCQTGEALSPLQSLDQIRVHAGYRVELVAAEPLVSDPVSIAFGPDQRLWVVEMRDYPFSDKSAGRGQIRILEDRDQDGQCQKESAEDSISENHQMMSPNRLERFGFRSPLRFAGIRRSRFGLGLTDV